MLPLPALNLALKTFSRWRGWFVTTIAGNFITSISLIMKILADVSGEEVEQYMIGKGLLQSSEAAADAPIDSSCTDEQHAVTPRRQLVGDHHVVPVPGRVVGEGGRC